MLDVVCSALPAAGERVHADVSVRPGGSALNAAVAAAAAGAAAGVVGRIGDDGAGDLLLAHLARLGVDAALARDATLPTGTAVAFTREGAEPGVVAMRGANARFGPHDVPATIDADALFVSGFALFRSDTAAAATDAIERFTGSWLGIDLASPDLARSARDLAPVRGNTVLFATAAEANVLTGAEAEEAARSLASEFAVVCVKLGAEGALAAAGGVVERRRIEAGSRRFVFGAGDAFAGELLVALAREEPLGRALELACAAGAGVAERAELGPRL